jgi:hypothetical protein
MSIYGTILDVHTDTVGEPLTAGAVATATTIAVVDADTFRDEGGLVRIGPDVYTYTAIDTELNTLTLASGLLRAVAADDLVEVYPLQQVKRAFVDTGIGGDSEGIWVTIPQTMVLTLPDGLRYEGQRETVLITERGPGDLVVADANAAANVAASTVLPEGSITPNLTEVGQVGQILQDPAFTGSSWAPPVKWSVVGPDTVYTDWNFARVTGDATANVVHDGGGTADWDWWLTDLVPVDPGRSVRVAALARHDATATTTAEARVRVVFYKADRVTALSDTTCVQGLIVSSMAVNTWLPLALSVNVPEGYAYFRAGLQVNGQTAGLIDFIKPEVQVLWNRMQSSNFVPGQTGWGLEGDTSQFPALNVLGSIGAGAISARSITVNGIDLETQYLDPLPLGIIAYDISTSGTHTANISTPETKLFEFSAPMRNGRLYKIVFAGHLQASVASDVFDFTLRYTTDGTTPTTASSLMRTWRVTMPAASPSTAFWLEKIYSPAADYGVVRLAISLVRAAGTGNAFIFNTQTERAAFFYVEDVGLYGPAAITGTLSQTSGVVQAAAKVTTTGTWYATWGRSFREAGGTTLAGDPDDLYQGVPYYSSDYGNSRSLFGFDYAAIQTALTGATVNWIKVIYRVKDAYDYSPYTTVSVASHNYTTKPTTWAAANVSTGRATFSGQQTGVTYSNTLPLAVASEFKAGTTRGLGFGPGLASTDFGFMYGMLTSDGLSPSLDRPRVQINYTK